MENQATTPQKYLGKAGLVILLGALSDIKEAPPSITDRVARGDLGAKTGVGFYDWRDVDMDAYRKRVNGPYWRFVHWDMPKE